ncbi:plasmid mobilization system relaxase [Rhizobium sp. ERR 922]|uniref:Ti-type conjugative transfer relaxase TraA n=1 Tax=unclassified Rhizobium TaxID=2613769 RepID=UPI0011A6C697|nr:MULTISPECIES: Ti-type conjugative transfer relaxase TraA [unclassified Rhizobium]TWB45566.1 plasmid mobilization system relaxase [Rhizobium sp. ERR 922]TWB88199.1 plasmid mobilization system relaxase [Rhizobium sp. ERR 942]
MAIYHCSMKTIARSGGRSAVASAAYRAAVKLTNERDGLVHDFTRKQGVDHAEIVLPEGVEADWARDRSSLWNAVERAEVRKDARVAREFEIALPHELTPEQRLSLTRDFACDLANRYGAAVDFAIHQPQGQGDVRNVHAHLLMTTRVVGETGLGEKTLIERENKWLLNNDQPTSHMQLRDIRQAWEHHANRHLVRAGLEVRIDHRSHLERGLEIEPTEHMGVHASQMDQRGMDVSRRRLEERAAQRNAALIREKPEQVLTIITGEKSVFDRHDVARALHRYIDDDAQAFRNAFAAVMASPALVELQPERDGELARYSTREMIEIEGAMAERVSKMGAALGHGVDRHHVDQAIDIQDSAIRARTASSLSGKVERGAMLLVDRERAIERSGLSEEQRLAVQHVTGAQQIAVVIGFAGAGKSTMLAAARDAWDRQGYRVHGAALAGKAAEGLEESSGIASRTLASWEYGWQAGNGELGKGDILVIDEAGMVGSRQLSRFVAEAEARGAKLVLVGDHEQLQAIGAGSPFRAIAERVGAVELSEIRRQKEDWQRHASIAFATHRTSEGLAAYGDRGGVQFGTDRDETRTALVRDYLTDLEQRPSGSRIALAHRRADVRAVNADIRAALQERGLLASNAGEGAAKNDRDADTLGREVVYRTNDGKRAFASGDRIVLLENNRDLGAKNGMLGTVQAVEADALHIRLDGSGDGRNGARVISIPVNRYQAFDHGYATTIHKSQGATIDRAFVMASASMDRHLTYVAMTRHRDSVKLYAGRDELKDMKVLSASLSRSGAKETTLDYFGAFAERRGLAEELGVRSEIVVSPSSGRDHERVGKPVEKVEPLVPALTTHSRGIEDVAREKARPDFERAMDAVRSVGGNVYIDPDGVAARLSLAIVDKGVDGHVLAKAVAERPEQFGELRGKSGLLGDNKERKAARHFAKGLSHHVASAGQVWERRLEAERQSETWNREKRDVIVVQGLTSRSEALLKQLDDLPQSEKPKFLEQLSATPEGRQALDEAKTIVQALERRFGSSDPRRLKKENLRLGPEVADKLDRIETIARITDRAHRAELSRQYELKRTLNKGLGLGM